MEQANRVLKKIIKIIKKPEMRILPGQLAFFLVISLIPLIALIGAIASSLSIDPENIRIALGNTMPAEVGEFFNEINNGQGLNFNIAVFFVSAFILASNGPHSMIITSNEIYKTQTPNIIRRRLKAIMMTFLLVGLFFFLLVVPIGGDLIFSLIRINIADNVTVDILYNIYQILKYPFIIAILYFNIKLIYVIAPDEKITSITTKKGAVFTTVGWIIATEIYSFYINTFSKYDLFYGSISNLLILLLWVYILSYIFVLGMIINAGSYQESKTAQLEISKE